MKQFNNNEKDTVPLQKKNVKQQCHVQGTPTLLQ